MVTRAKIALTQKKLTKTPLGGHYSCVDEEKALQLARRRLEEAETKLANVQKWNRRLDEEVFEYKGQVQALGRMVGQRSAGGHRPARPHDRGPRIVHGGEIRRVARIWICSAAFASVARDSRPDALLDSPWQATREAAYQELRRADALGRGADAGGRRAGTPIAGRPCRSASPIAMALQGSACPRHRRPRIPGWSVGAGCETAARVYLERVEPAGPRGQRLVRWGRSRAALRRALGHPSRRPAGPGAAVGGDTGSCRSVRWLSCEGDSVEALLDGRDAILWPDAADSAEKRRQP